MTTRPLAVSFNPTKYRFHLKRFFLLEVQGISLTAYTYLDQKGEEWTIYQDGQFQVSSSNSYLASFQEFKSGIKIVVIRPARSSEDE